jgi:hypothetical protein
MQLGIDNVEELYPEWKDNKVHWHKEIVKADESLMSLLEQPSEAISHFCEDLECPPNAKPL